MLRRNFFPILSEKIFKAKSKEMPSKEQSPNLVKIFLLSSVRELLSTKIVKEMAAKSAINNTKA